jgi:phage protein D
MSLLPTFENGTMTVTLGGKNVMEDNLGACLSSVVVKESLEALDALTVVFAIPEGISKLKDFDFYGKEWAVKVMMNGIETRGYFGDVLNVQWTRSGGSSRQCTVTGVGYLHRLKRGRAAVKPDDRRFKDKKYSEIVTAIAKDWGLAASGIEASDGKHKVSERAQDDATWLKELAASAGYILRMDYSMGSKAIVFAKRESYANQKVTLEFGVDVLSVNATHNLDPMITSATAETIDHLKNDAKVKGDSKASDLSLQNDAAYSGPKLMARVAEFPLHLAEAEGKSATQSAAKEQAKGAMNDRAAQFVEGSLTCRFRPDLGCNRKVEIKGAGWPFDGNFLVKEVTHSFDATGYRTAVTFSANSIKAPS